MAVNRKKMLDSLDTIINKPGGATWDEISEGIKAEGYDVTNWLTQVRGPLAEMMNEGLIARAAGSGVTIPETYIPL